MPARSAPHRSSCKPAKARARLNLGSCARATARPLIRAGHSFGWRVRFVSSAKRGATNLKAFAFRLGRNGGVGPTLRTEAGTPNSPPPCGWAVGERHVPCSPSNLAVSGASRLRGARLPPTHVPLRGGFDVCYSKYLTFYRSKTV